MINNWLCGIRVSTWKTLPFRWSDYISVSPTNLWEFNNDFNQIILKELLFLINLKNIDYQFFGTSSNGQGRHLRIYNRFFEIGLFSACRFFFDSAIEDIEILWIFSERRDLGGTNPFLILTPYKINQRKTNIVVKSRQIIPVDGNPLK